MAMLHPGSRHFGGPVHGPVEHRYGHCSKGQKEVWSKDSLLAKMLLLLLFEVVPPCSLALSWKMRVT
jgi:hypothetical protein